MIINSQIQTALTGALGIGSSEAATVLIQSDTTNIISIITQVAIAIATLIGLFKRKNNKTNTQ